MEKREPYRVLGLDIGIASCGWSVLDLANKQLVDMGVHLWDPPQEPKTKTSTAATRRAGRSQRRNTKRTADRKKHCFELFQRYGLAPKDATREWIQTVKGDVQPLEARAEGLSRVLSDREFAQALYNICARRGYIPHGEGSDTDDPDAGKVLKAIDANKRLMAERGYETVGQLLFENFANNTASRNKGGDYAQCITNAQLQDEVRVLFARQRALGNARASEEFCTDYLACLTWQQPSDEHDEKVYRTVGKCTYFPEEMRAAKACTSFELCAAYERVNHVTYVTPDKVEHKLPPYVKAEAIKTLFSPVPLPKNKDCKVTYARLRDLMDLPATAYFKGVDNAEESTRKVADPKVWSKLRATLPKDLMLRFAEDRALADDVCSALAYASSERSLNAKLDELDIDDAERAALLKLPYASKLFSDYGARSLKALGMLIDAFEDTESITTLAEAEDACGLHDKFLEKPARGVRLPPYVHFDTTCKNPVVLRVMGRVRRVVNAVIATYGMPDEIHIELARELKIPKSARNKIARNNNDRAKQREIDAQTLAELLRCAPEEVSPSVLRKYELWKEQDGYDLYVGQPIELERLLAEDAYCQIDHILPYSRTCDDSQMNKILVLAKSNQDKRERTPFEWLSAEGLWETFEKNIVSLRASGKYPRKKIEHLLEVNLDSEKQATFIARNMNDTRYATRATAQYVEQYLAFPGEEHKKNVRAIAGGATSALRSAWGFAKKDREVSDTHHAVDAAIIAACDNSRVIGVARAHEQKYYVPKEKRGQLFEDTEPWEGFVAQVEAREATLVPTRMVDHGGTGRLFEDSVYSFVGLNEKGTQGILRKSGVDKVCGNYVLREDGSVVKPDEIVFFRVWWNEETKHYHAEPVYYADLDAMRHDKYVPRMAKCGSQRHDWNPIPEVAMKEKPIVIRKGDVILLDGQLVRFKNYGIAAMQLVAVGMRNFMTTRKVSSINSLREKEKLRVINEDILGLCYQSPELQEILAKQLPDERLKEEELRKKNSKDKG